MTKEKHAKPHVTTYYVNGEAETTDKRELTVREILESAGFTPATDYSLASENPPDDYDSDYDKVVRVHEHQRFQAVYKGPTNVS